MFIIFFSFFQILMADDLPKEFDLRTKYTECPSVSSPLNQGSCGSCWAFSTTSTTADRLCMRGWTTEFMAPEHPVQCDAGQEGCNGGYIKTAFDFQVTNGLIPLVCKAYRDTQTRRCADTCDDKSPITANMLLKPSARKERLQTNDDIKKEIYTFGSVTGSFRVFEEFYDFFEKNKSGHYFVSTTPGEFETYHAVKMIGWDPTGWLIQNSWGKSWADGGYFRIKYGEGEIEKDVYAPVVPEYIDACAAQNGFTCGECNNVTEKINGVETNYTCKYCLTSDKCIQVTNKGEPAHGMCQKFAEDASQCPIDDCEQMSADPLRCLSHKGCGYCVSTKKCRKGLDGPNTGVCQNWFKELGNFTAKYSGTRYFDSSSCTDEKQLWCEGIGKCLDKTPSLNSTQVGRCKGVANADGSAGEIMLAKVCGDYTDRAACNTQGGLSCEWNFITKRCDNNDTNPTSTGILLGTVPGTVPDPITDAECLRYTCKTCKSAPGCVWCGTTQSCIAWLSGEGNDTVTAETNCSKIVDSSSDEDSCSECIQYSSCTSCAVDTSCGWWEVSSFCAEGRKTSKSLNKPRDNDRFLPYKTQCEIVAVDQLEPFDASLDYNTGGAGGAAARIVRVPQVATYMLAAVATLLALLIMG